MVKVTVKLDEIRKMSAAERLKLLQNLREQHRAISFEVKSDQSQAVRKVRHLKKSIARVLTVVNSKTEAKAK